MLGDIDDRLFKAAGMGAKLVKSYSVQEEQVPSHGLSMISTGDHETFVTKYGEFDLSKDLKCCKKNPGHAHLIPVETFTLKHLPKGYRDDDLYEVIKAVADLTVRVDVRMISANRPEFWSGTSVPYPFYDIRESTLLRTASGKVKAVDRYVNGKDQHGRDHSRLHTTCMCRKCRISGTPMETWWEFVVLTASQAVFDSAEASRTSCRLFYDTQDSNAVTLGDVTLRDANVEEDWCELLCVTCDIGLGDRLFKRMENSLALWRKVDDKFRASRDDHRLAFVVSHPHGCAKRLSLGRWMDKHQVGEPCRYAFTYTARTCPGSSGAMVCCVGYSGWRYYHHVHSLTLKSGLNYSSVGSLV